MNVFAREPEISSWPEAVAYIAVFALVAFIAWLLLR